jgi:hypothetical protein
VRLSGTQLAGSSVHRRVVDELDRLGLGALNSGFHGADYAPLPFASFAIC